jgi:hypothetical protein
MNYMNTKNPVLIKKHLLENLNFLLLNYDKCPELYPTIRIINDAMRMDKIYRSVKDEHKSYVDKVFHFTNSLSRMIDMTKIMHEDVWYDLVKPFRVDIDSIIEYEKESRKIFGDELYEKIKKKEYPTNEDHAETMCEILDKLGVDQVNL